MESSFNVPGNGFRRADEWPSSCAGPAASLPALFGRCRSNEQPLDRRLNEAGAEVEVPGGDGLKPDFQAACAFACEPIVRYENALTQRRSRPHFSAETCTESV
jgi:hypothetical protein